MNAEVDAAPRQRGVGASVAVLAVLGGAAAWLLSRPAPEAAGPARLRSPEILLAVFDTVWLLLAALPRTPSLAGAATKLVAGAPFHVAIAAAFGAAPGFHVAWGLAIAAFAAVGAVGARLAPGVHGTAVAVLSFALPLGAYAAGEFGGAEVRGLFLASPTVMPAVLARTSRTATPADAIPALAAAASLLLVALVAARRRTERA